MQEYEASNLLKYLEFTDRNTKELVRYQLLVAINSMSKEKFSAHDILALKWDDKYLDKLENAYKEEEAKYLDNQSDEMESILNNNLFKAEDTNMMG